MPGHQLWPWPPHSGGHYKVGKEMEVGTSPRGTKAPQGEKIKGYLCLAISCGLGHLTWVAIQGQAGKEIEVGTSPRGTKASQGEKVKEYLCLAIICGLGHLTRAAIQGQVGKEMEVETSPRGTKALQGKKDKGYLCLAISCDLGHLTHTHTCLGTESGWVGGKTKPLFVCRWLLEE